MYRLEPQAREWIDRSTVLRFLFEDAPCEG